MVADCWRSVGRERVYIHISGGLQTGRRVRRNGEKLGLGKKGAYFRLGQRSDSRLIRGSTRGKGVYELSRN